MPIIQTAFSSGYLGEIVDGSFVAELTTGYRDRSNVPTYMQERGEKVFQSIGDAVTTN